MENGRDSSWERHSRRRITSSSEFRTRCGFRNCSDAALSASQRADSDESELRRQSAVATGVCTYTGSVLSVSLYETSVVDLHSSCSPHQPARRGGQTVYLSAATEERAVRRLSRDQGSRPVSRPRKSRFGSDQEMGRGGEQAHLRLSRDHSGANQNQRQDDGALELREVHGAVSRRRPLFLLEEHRAPEPECRFH